MSKDLSPFLTKVKMSGAEVLYTSDWGLDISVLIKQRHELGIKAVLLGSSLADVTVLRESPEAALGAIPAQLGLRRTPRRKCRIHQ